jgi:hypothetical protein
MSSGLFTNGLFAKRAYKFQLSERPVSGQSLKGANIVLILKQARRKTVLACIASAVFVNIGFFHCSAARLLNRRLDIFLIGQTETEPRQNRVANLRYG